MAVVRELITRFGFNVDQTGMNRVEGSINRLSGMLSGLAAFASLRALAGVADSMQSLEARIGMLPQTIGDVGAAFNEVAKNASDNRQSINAYGTLYARIGNAAKEYINTQKDLITVSNTISQALVVGGATTQEASSVMIQFSQALGAGTLQGEEFRAMAEAAPQYMDALAEAMGHPRSELKKLASEGKLSSKAVIEATLKMSTMFQEKFRQMPMTIGAATTIIGNKFKTMIAGLNRESQVVTNVANFLLNGFDKIESGAKSFIEFVGGSANAVKAFGIALIALLSPLALGGFIKIIGMLLSPAGLLAGMVLLLGLAIDDVVNYLKGGQSVFGSFLGWLNSGTLGAAAMQGAVIALAAAITGYLGAALIGVASKFISTLALSYALSGGLLPLIANFAILAGQAIATGVAIAAGWVMALGPIGLVIAGIAAVSTALIYLYKNWEKVKGFFVNMTGGNSVTSISPASVAGASAGGVKNVTSNQTVNLTVPSGTPESQQAFLQNAAGVLKGESPEKKLARDMSGGGW